MPRANVVQLNNDYIKDQHLQKRYELEVATKRRRFLGWILLLVMLLFILPTYNLIMSYQDLQDKHQEVIQLKAEHKKLSQEVADKQLLITQMKDETFAAKYARAKYYYSKPGELVFSLPDLLPK